MLENIRLAFQGIWTHKMRSFLTMLGIIIGIASIISIVSTIKGTTEQIKEQLIGAGNNAVKVLLYDGSSEYDASWGMTSTGQLPQLTDEQKEEVRKLEDVENCTFFYNRGYSDNIYYMDRSMQGGKVYGIDEEYLATCGYVIQAGRGFVKADYEGYRKVALLDEEAVGSLFQDETPLGKTIEIRGEPFVVVGVYAEAEKFQPIINDYQEYYTYYGNAGTGTLLVPNVDWPIIYKYDEPENAVIKAANTEAMTKVGDRAAKILNGDLEENSQIRYKSNDNLEMAKKQQDLSQSTNGQLLWIASISLLVGGIGVMNIMLVSVTERTSEIGLKKAIGARKKRILFQFLTEAAVLTSMGGVVGVVSGIVMANVISRMAGIPIAISVPAIVASVGFSMVIGIVFGLLPSIKAANLNPIEALRRD